MGVAAASWSPPPAALPPAWQRPAAVLPLQPPKYFLGVLPGVDPKPGWGKLAGMDPATCTPRLGCMRSWSISSNKATAK